MSQFGRVDPHGPPSLEELVSYLEIEHTLALSDAMLTWVNAIRPSLMIVSMRQMAGKISARLHVFACIGPLGFLGPHVGHDNLLYISLLLVQQ